jgi:molecular chaperone GrpE
MDEQNTSEPVMTAEIVEIEQEEVIDPAKLGLALPADPTEREQALLHAVAEAREEATSYLDDLRRVAADFENYRKRMQRDLALTVELASERLVERLLPVLDTFDAALQVEVASEAEQRMLGGMRGTHQQLLTALKAEGLELVPTVGEPFDPEVHEAVTTSAEGEGPLVVTEEMRRGYTLKGKLVRAALVAVGHE